MLTGVCVGTDNLAAAGEFYDTVLATVGMHRSMQNDLEIGYAIEGGPNCFWVIKPYNGKHATYGNGTQVIFSAQTKDQVATFHSAALAAGGRNEGAPGQRNYREGYYGAYCRDLDGNKLHVFYVDN
ncbi:MAG: VOC family protein [Gammaproteobacteria bacterium]|nr:VOC family protein [Gammaproteobacteria bacterium]